MLEMCTGKYQESLGRGDLSQVEWIERPEAVVGKEGQDLESASFPSGLLQLLICPMALRMFLILLGLSFPSCKRRYWRITVSWLLGIPFDVFSYELHVMTHCSTSWHCRIRFTLSILKLFKAMWNYQFIASCVHEITHVSIWRWSDPISTTEIYWIGF